MSKRAFRRELEELLKREEIDAVLDVGGHRGAYGHRLRELGYGGRIVSFEPLRKNASTRSGSSSSRFPYSRSTRVRPDMESPFTSWTMEDSSR